MASTYSPNLRLELIGTGEQQGTWGNTTNTNLGTLLEQAIGGYVSVTVTDGADTTLTTVNGGSDQSRNAVINLTGTLTATRNVICPAIQKVYIVKNATTGGFAVTFKVSGQTGVSIPNGSTYILFVDGTDARLVTANLANQLANNVAITGGSITGITDLAVADGGTGASDAATARTNLGIGTIATQNSNNVTITGGSVTGITDLAVADGGTGASDAATARTNLGLGTISTQNSNAVAITGGNITGLTNLSASNVSITGGSITGITDLALADGGTGASLADPNANAVLGWNDTANTMRFFTAGTGITIDPTTNTISSTAAGGGNYVMTAYTNTTPGGVTWTKPANLVAIKVTVVGGGGGTSTISPTGGVNSGAGAGGAAVKYIPAPSIPGPVTVTVGAAGTTSPTTGGTSSFGAFVSATGGSGSGVGAGSNGTYNIGGGTGTQGTNSSTTVPSTPTPTTVRITQGGAGGNSILGAGGDAPTMSITTGPSLGPNRAASAGNGYGSGASGGAATGTAAGASGGQGIVIVEEFY